MPAELRTAMGKYISGSRTMTLGKCQGGDAMLEEINKETKSWLKMTGIPTEDQWLHVFRNLDDLSKVRKYLKILYFRIVKCHNFCEYKTFSIRNICEIVLSQKIYSAKIYTFKVNIY